MSNTIGPARNVAAPPTSELFPAALPPNPKTGACPLGSDRIVSHATNACVPRQTPGAAAASTLVVAGIVAAPFAAADAAADIGITSFAGAKEYGAKALSGVGKKLSEEVTKFAPPLRDPEAVGSAIGTGIAKFIEGSGLIGVGAIAHSLLERGKATIEKHLGGAAQP